MIETNNNQPVPQMVTIKELAQATNISEYCIRKLCINNQISYIKSGAKYLLNLDLFIDYLNGKKQEAI